MALALIPLGFLIFFVAEFGMDIPYWDEWDFVPLIEKSYQGNLAFQDLWGQLNAQRPFFTRIIIIGLAQITKWNISYELVLSIILSIGIFTIITYQIRRTAKSFGNNRMLWVIPIVSLIVFSLGQEENWLMGMDFQYFLNVFAVVFVITLLSNPKFSWFRIIISILLGIIATYTEFPGIFIWIIGLFVLLSNSHRNRKDKIKISVWIVAGIIILTTFFYDYHSPESVSSFSFLSNPLEYLKYVFNYLGAPLFAFGKQVNNIQLLNRFPLFMNGAAIVGFFGLIIGFILMWLFICKEKIAFNRFTPYLAYSFYSIFSALATGIGRVGLKDPYQALSTRYITFSSLLWITNILLLSIVISEAKLDFKNRSKKWIKRSGQLALTVIVTLLIINAIYGSITGIYRNLKWSETRNVLLGIEDDSYLERYNPLLQLLSKSHKDELFKSTNEDILKRIYPDLEILLERVEIMKKRQLSLFREK